MLGSLKKSRKKGQASTLSTPIRRTRFPDKLREYVKRAIQDCRLEAWPEVEAELKRIITDAFNDRVVWNLDWDKAPLPQETLTTKACREARNEENHVPDAQAS